MEFKVPTSESWGSKRAYARNVAVPHASIKRKCPDRLKEQQLTFYRLTPFIEPYTLLLVILFAFITHRCIPFSSSEPRRPASDWAPTENRRPTLGLALTFTEPTCLPSLVLLG